MTLDRFGGDWCMSCDRCCFTDTDLDGDLQFSEAIDAMKERGWRVFKKRGDYEHVCPSCIEDEREVPAIREGTDVL